MMTARSMTVRLETVLDVRSRQSVWADWMARDTEGLRPDSLVITVTTNGGVGSYLSLIAKEKTCSYCEEMRSAQEFTHDPAPVAERICNDCVEELAHERGEG